MKSLGIYLHIPFCMKKCNYCDFLSYEDQSQELKNNYLKSLILEIKEKGILYKGSHEVDSIFMGGGTPSLLTPVQVQNLMMAVADSFTIRSGCEITIEANPGTLSLDKMRLYQSLGINRMSMGVQSLNNKILDFMGRIHKAEDFYRNFQDARTAGFDNVNVDLMFAVPGMTTDIWMDTLTKVILLEPEHISFYGLQLEEGTSFFHDFEKGLWQEVSDMVDRKQYWDGIALLQNVEQSQRSDYVHYEISNAAKEGYQCRHNLKYWSLEEYVGFGLGAHSFVGGSRFSNSKSLKQYMENPMKPEWFHKNTKKESMEEYLFTGMRKMSGISVREFEKQFQCSIFEIYEKQIQELKAEGYIEVTVEGMMKLTHRGIDFSNRALAVFV